MAFDLQGTASNLERKYGLPSGSYVKLLTLGERSRSMNAVSPKGAIGWAQLLPTTAADMGVDPWNEQQNLEGGAKYLKAMYDRYKGDLKLAYAAYNAGPGAVDRYGGVPPFAETQNYVGRVMGTTPVAANGMPAASPMPSLMTPEQQQQQQQVMTQYGDALKHADTVNKQVEESLTNTSTDLGRISSELAALQAQPRPKPPTIANLPDAPEQDDYIKDPTRVLGQVLPGLAVLLSAHGRRGAINAMSAAAAAMQAAKTNDREAYERAHQDWKAKMQATLQQAELERQQYLDVLNDRRMTMTEKLAELQVLAAQGDNDKMKAMIANGQTGEIYKYLQMMDVMTWRGYQVYDRTQQLDLERQKLGLEKDKLRLNEEKAKALDDYRRAQIDVAKEKADKNTMGQLAAELTEKKRQAANGVAGVEWTQADEAALSDLTMTLQRMNFKDSSNSSSPGDAPAGAGHPVVTNAAVAYLKANDNPQMRKLFDEKYGPGSAKKYLGY